jgi:hypothetical protein
VNALGFISMPDLVFCSRFLLRGHESGRSKALSSPMLASWMSAQNFHIDIELSLVEKVIYNNRFGKESDFPGERAS